MISVYEYGIISGCGTGGLGTWISAAQGFRIQVLACKWDNEIANFHKIKTFSRDQGSIRSVTHLLLFLKLFVLTVRAVVMLLIPLYGRASSATYAVTYTVTYAVTYASHTLSYTLSHTLSHMLSLSPITNQCTTTIEMTSPELKIKQSDPDPRK